MVLMIPRAAAALVRGYVRSGSAVPGLGVTTPHVAQARCGLLDVDIFMHMNNAAFFSHCELARWQLIAEVGAIPWIQRNKAVFLVGSTVTRFRREVRPLQAFEVHTQVLGWDERSLVFEHNFRLSADSPPLSQTLCRAVVKSKGKTVAPEDFFGAMGVPPDLVAARRGTSAGNDTVAAFAALDAAQKASATAA
jgi:acyl-CoA thioesterase FadM